jgi:GMP synthase-like glutamine amidotransferase
MVLHILQHAGFEGPGAIIDWAEKNHISVGVTQLFREEQFPKPDTFDFLVIMGGPMSVDDTPKYPWLEEEKSFIKEAVTGGKKVLGICLGAQLLAQTLGAKVYPNRHKEIGWFPVQKKAFSHHPALEIFPENTLPAFHWHGDTFDLPADATLLFSSEATRHQAFVWNNRVFGLQFHWEVKPENVRLLLKHSTADLEGGGAFIRPPEEMTGFSPFFAEAQKNLFRLLNFMAGI